MRGFIVTKIKIKFSSVAFCISLFSNIGAMEESVGVWEKIGERVRGCLDNEGAVGNVVHYPGKKYPKLFSCSKVMQGFLRWEEKIDGNSLDERIEESLVKALAGYSKKESLDNSLVPSLLRLLEFFFKNADLDKSLAYELGAYGSGLLAHVMVYFDIYRGNQVVCSSCIPKTLYLEGSSKPIKEWIDMLEIACNINIESWFVELIATEIAKQLIKTKYKPDESILDKITEKSKLFINKAIINSDSKLREAILEKCKNGNLLNVKVGAGEIESAKFSSVGESILVVFSSDPFFLEGYKDKRVLSKNIAKSLHYNLEPICEVKNNAKLRDCNKFSPDGRYFFSVRDNAEMRLLDTKSKKTVARRLDSSNEIKMAKFSHDSELILVVYGNDSRDTAEFLCHDLKPLQFTPRYKSFPGHDIELVAINPVRPTVFVVSTNHIACCNNANYLAVIWDLEKEDYEEGAVVECKFHDDFINSVMFSPSGEQAVTASDDKTAKIWNLSGKCVRALGHTGRVNSAAFSANGQLVLTASDDKTAKIWNLFGECVKTLCHPARVGLAVFSPDGELILTKSGKVRAFDSAGRCITTLNGYVSKRDCDQLFSFDSRLVLVGCGKGNIKVCNVKKILDHFDSELSRLKIQDVLGFTQNTESFLQKK